MLNLNIINYILSSKLIFLSVIFPFLLVYPMTVTAADANESSVLTASCWSCKLLVNIGQPSAGPKIYRGDSFSAPSHQRYHHEYADEAFSGKPHNSPAGDLSCSPHFDFALCIPFQSTPRIPKFFSIRSVANGEMRIHWHLYTPKCR